MITEPFRNYRTRPIPGLDAVREKKTGYRSWPINWENALCREELCDARERGLAVENFYYQTDNAPYFQRAPHSIPGLWLRSAVVGKLQKVNRLLQKAGIEVYLLDGYRPIEMQNFFHDEWFPNYLRSVQPGLTEAEIRTEVETYWAVGTGLRGLSNPELSPPPHATGGAVDLTLRKIRNGEHLYMGSIFDDLTPLAYTDALEKNETRTESESFSMREGRANRRLLYWIMTEEGFVNNPTEWWHYSWGDQMWAALGDAAAALYSWAKH